MFENLKKKKNSIERKSQKHLFCNCPIFIPDQKLFTTLISQINFLHKQYFHIRYEKAYQHKKFQNFNIKTLTIIACVNFKNWFWAFSD